MKEVMPNGREETRTSRADVTGAAHPSNAGAAGGREESPWREIAEKLEMNTRVLGVIRRAGPIIRHIEQAIELAVEATWDSQWEQGRWARSSKPPVKEVAKRMAALLEQKGAK
jgi:hypothetical protein